MEKKNHGSLSEILIVYHDLSCVSPVLGPDMELPLWQSIKDRHHKAQDGIPEP